MVSWCLLLILCNFIIEFRLHHSWDALVPPRSRLLKSFPEWEGECLVLRGESKRQLLPLAKNAVASSFISLSELASNCLVVVFDCYYLVVLLTFNILPAEGMYVCLKQETEQSGILC